MTTTSTSFRISGAFITEKARELWQDGELRRALDILASLDPLPELEQALDVLGGRLELTGDSNKGCNLAETPSSSHKAPANRRGSAPREADPRAPAWKTLLDALRSREAAHAAVLQENQELRAALADDLQPRGSPEGLVFVPMNRKRLPPLPSFQPPVLSPELQRATDHQLEVLLNPTETAPTPVRRITTTDGWLNPNGQFYPVRRTEHRAVAELLGSDEPTLERDGWVKVCTSFDGKLLILADDTAVSKGLVTPRQRRLVHDYCLERALMMPDWVDPENL